MAERELVPPAEQWHEVTIVIPKCQDRSVAAALRRPAASSSTRCGRLDAASQGSTAGGGKPQFAKERRPVSTDLVIACQTALQTS
jgi:hypothetical protein